MDYEQNPTRAEAFGDLLAGIAPVASLIAYRAELERDLLTDEQRDERLRERMRGQGLTFRSILAEHLPPQLDELPLSQVLHRAVDLFMASRPGMTVGDAIRWVNEQFSLDEMGLAFITSRAKGGTDNSLLSAIDGRVVAGVMGSKTDSPMPYVVAGATPKTDLNEHIAEYRRVCRETFAGIPNPEPATIAFVARCVAARDSGMGDPRFGRELTPKEVALKLYDETPLDAAGGDSEDFDRLYARVRQALTRDLDRVTETRRPVSQE